MLKKDRGCFEVANISNQDKEYAVVRWKDNGVAIMASNCFGSDPIQKAKQWDKKKKKNVFVDVSYAIHNYNSSMAGTDHQDQNVNKYRISICTKKWWWPLLLFGFCFVEIIQIVVYLISDGMLPDAF